MASYIATIQWIRNENESFTDNRYSRGHTWSFDGGITIPASASPHIVPLPYSVEENVDPEEAFVASISSCHMLFFLSIAAKSGWVVEQYIDHATGFMEKDEDGKNFIKRVILAPQIQFSESAQPAEDEISDIHHRSHKQCFIANSIKSEVIIQQPDQID